MNYPKLIKSSVISSLVGLLFGEALFWSSFYLSSLVLCDDVLLIGTSCTDTGSMMLGFFLGYLKPVISSVIAIIMLVNLLKKSKDNIQRNKKTFVSLSLIIAVTIVFTASSSVFFLAIVFRAPFSEFLHTYFDFLKIYLTR